MKRSLVAVVVALAALSCVSGNKIRADAEVIKADIERARRTGAIKCAPRELATAEAKVDFALDELSRGNSFRAGEEIHQAESAAKKALYLSKDCGPKQILVREQTGPVQPRQVIKIEQTDRDGDGVPDNIDKCPDEPGPASNNGCPLKPTDVDRDGDGLVDSRDRCPNTPGAIENLGCPILDRDGDGVPDNLDQCPDEPGPASNNGCPEQDRDHDGVLDRDDRCPNTPGTQENLGCPDSDRDHDGIPDRLDKCPDEPEDKDGFQDEDGCPDLDNDQDGIPDSQDRCPNTPGPAENQGCPDSDRDGDGIPDRLDKCPDEFGVKEEQGCPKKYKLVVVKKDRIEIKQQINFKSSSAKIIGAQSFEIISEIAAAMRDNPQIKKVRIEGHTDSVGKDSTNLRLSQSRADAVRTAMLKEGVDPGRLDSVGFGSTKPIDTNRTRQGRAANRRTEFNIIEQ